MPSGFPGFHCALRLQKAWRLSPPIPLAYRKCKKTPETQENAPCKAQSILFHNQFLFSAGFYKQRIKIYLFSCSLFSNAVKPVFKSSKVSSKFPVYHGSAISLSFPAYVKRSFTLSSGSLFHSRCM